MSTASITRTSSQLELRPRAEPAEPPAPTDVVTASRLADSTVPDGGYGWIVVVGCSLVTFWFVGTSYCWGVIQAALVAEQLSSPTTLSFVGSLYVSCVATLALVNARVIRALGAQWTGLLGIGLLGLGEIASSFSTRNIGGLFVCTGVIMGVGTSLCFMVVSVTPAQYFSKKRGLANGIVYAGGGLGGTVISFAMNGLIEKLGPAWTYRVIGFITLATGLPAAWLIRERAPIRSASFIDWSLLRETRFIALLLTGALAMFPLFVPPFFLPLYAASLGLSTSAGAGLVAGFNFSSAVGRLVCGFSCDLIGPLNTLFIALATSAVSMLVLWPVSSSLGPLIAFVVINGAANGGFFSSMPTVVGSVFGSARVSVAMGMVVTGWSAGYFLVSRRTAVFRTLITDILLQGAPIAGYILDAYGGQEAGFAAYHPAIFYAGSVASASAAMAALVRLRLSTSLLKKL